MKTVANFAIEFRARSVPHGNMPGLGQFNQFTQTSIARPFGNYYFRGQTLCA
jgi:hypothetical protein